jgi:hypothetical protein
MWYVHTHLLDSNISLTTRKTMLVLSGGLGGSQYVKTKIESLFAAKPHQNAPGLSILKSQEPRLAVVKGLVLDRRQKLISGTATLKTRM